MNILPKKSWHVRNKNNIERVRRDEEKAAQEELEKQRRIALAESEARTDLLRVKARKRKHEDERESDRERDSSVVQSSSKHINFFEELEQGKKLGGKNKEYEEEKKKEKEDQEKAIGLLTYLGQGSVELTDQKPWYFTAPNRKSLSDEAERKKDEVDSKKKSSLDPMSMMNRYVSVSKKVIQAREGNVSSRSEVTRVSKPSSSQSVSRPQAVKTVEELRAERLKREQEERLREKRLIESKLGGGAKQRDEPVVDERNIRYNSQFNPDFVKRPKPSASYSQDIH